jgi:hypothetical protein
MILRREIYVSICCFLLASNIEAAPDNSVQGDSWSLQMHRSGDGPINVESEHSRFDENGVIETNREAGELSVDDRGKVYIKKNDELNKQNQRAQTVPETFHRPATREFRPPPGTVREDINEADERRSGVKRNSGADFSDYSISQRIERELFEIRELTTLDADGPDPFERYRIVKKKLKKIKKLSRALFDAEKRASYEKRKFKEHCPWYKKIFRRDLFPYEDTPGFEKNGRSQ